MWSWRILGQGTVRKEPHWTVPSRDLCTVNLIRASQMKLSADQWMNTEDKGHWRRNDDQSINCQNRLQAFPTFPFFFLCCCYVWAILGNLLSGILKTSSVPWHPSTPSLCQHQAFLPNLSLGCVYGAVEKPQLWNQRCLGSSWLAL